MCGSALTMDIRLPMPLETEAGYGVYSHGHAVAQGMRFAARLAVAHLGASMEFVQTQDALLDSLGLPELQLKA